MEEEDDEDELEYVEAEEVSPPSYGGHEKEKSLPGGVGADGYPVGFLWYSCSSLRLTFVCFLDRQEGPTRFTGSISYARGTGDICLAKTKSEANGQGP